MPIDGFFEWMAIKGAKVKQPYAIAMKDRSPFGLAGLWENWKNPATGEWVRTFCIITTSANELVGRIHDRMPRSSGRKTTAGGSPSILTAQTSYSPSPPSRWRYGLFRPA